MCLAHNLYVCLPHNDSTSRDWDCTLMWWYRGIITKFWISFSVTTKDHLIRFSFTNWRGCSYENIGMFFLFQPDRFLGKHNFGCRNVVKRRNQTGDAFLFALLSYDDEWKNRTHFIHFMMILWCFVTPKKRERKFFQWISLLGKNFAAPLPTRFISCHSNERWLKCASKLHDIFRSLSVCLTWTISFFWESLPPV